MSRRILALCAVAGLVTTGCLKDTTGLDCQQVSTLVTGTSGDTVSIASGLRFIELQVGTGAAAQSCQVASVNYIGRLTDGTVFDESQSALNLIPGAARLIPGFEQGVVGMKIGGTRRLIIPPALGYGSAEITDPTTGEVKIPANSTIIFDVELVAAAQGAD